MSGIVEQNLANSIKVKECPVKSHKAENGYSSTQKVEIGYR